MSWLPLIGGAISAVGKLFGGGSKTTRNRVDYARMRRDAEAAGFNPLTALRNGGSAGYAVTHHPSLSAANVFGEALSSFGGFIADYDASANERASAEMELLNAQLGLVQAQTKRVQSLDVLAAQAPSDVNQPQPPLGDRLNPMPTHIYYRDRDGNTFRGTNPELPDIDQILVPGFMKVDRDTYTGAKKVDAMLGPLWRKPAFSGSGGGGF